MRVDVVFYDVLIDVLHLVMFSLAGAALAKLGIFDRVGEKKSAEANLHIFIPLFCLVLFSRVVSTMSWLALGWLCLTFVASCIVAALLAVAYCRVFRADVRVSGVFTLLATFGNVAFFPEVVTGALCEKEGGLAGDVHCGLANGYSMYVLFLFNVILLCVGPFFMHRDKALVYNLRRQMILVKHFYPSPQAFLDDHMLSLVDKQQKEKYPPMQEKPALQEKSSTVAILMENDLSPKEKFAASGPSNNKSVLDDPELVAFSLGIHADRATYKSFQLHFDAFLDKLQPNVFSALYDGKVPGPETAPSFSFKLCVEIVTNPTVVGCIAGFVFGLLPPVTSWLYSPQIMKIFMGVIEALGNFAVPLAVMIWGVQLVTGFGLKGLNIRLHEIVALVAIRLVLVPTIGLGFVRLLARGGIPELDQDAVLTFSMFANWCVPPGLLLLTLFVLGGYYAKEGAVMMFWSMLAAVVAVPLFTLAYFGLFSVGAA